jgi:hypothetical protein
MEERLIQLGKGKPDVHIDAACQQHDICYERHGRNHCLCDSLLMDRLCYMDFEGEAKHACKTARGQALYYFLSFHPTECSNIWATRNQILPLIGFGFPLLMGMSVNFQPEGDQKCYEIKPPKSKSYEHQKMAEMNAIKNKNQPEITITGLSQKQIINKFSNYMYEIGNVLKRLDGSIALYGKLDNQNELGPTELGKDPLELRTMFFFKDIVGGVRISCTSMAFVVNQDSDYEGIFEFGVSDDANKKALQKLLYTFRDKLKVNSQFR